MTTFNSETIVRYRYIARNVGGAGAGADYKMTVRAAAEALVPEHLVPPAGPLPGPARKYADKVEASILEALGNGLAYESRGFVVSGDA